MRFKKNFLLNYVRNAPFALAIERSMECEIMSGQEFVHPILDIGCGDGLFAYMLFDEQIDVGIDVNGRELQRAKEFGMYAELIQCYGNNIPKDSEFFKTIFSNSVLEHIPEFQVVLSEAYRLLAPGGRLYVTVPTDRFDTYSMCYQVLSLLRLDSLAEKYRRFFNGFWKHFHYHTRADWEQIFESAGFELIYSKEYGSKATCLMDDMLVPLAFFSFATKQMFNRWILLPGLRKIYIYPLYLIAKGLLRKFERGNEGGVIFFAFEKK